MTEEEQKAREILNNSRQEIRKQLVRLSAIVPTDLQAEIETLRRHFTHEWLAADLLIAIGSQE